MLAQAKALGGALRWPTPCGRGPRLTCSESAAKPSHSAVFAQISPEGSRLSALARGANMTPQAMGELVDELEELGYVERRPDPTDRRAKLIMLTPRGHDCIAAGIATIQGIERRIDQILGATGHAELRRLLTELLTSAATD